MSEYKYIITSDGELYHYKYIKREKVNGKWRYYYKDTELDQKIAEQDKKYKDAVARANTAKITAEKYKQTALNKVMRGKDVSGLMQRIKQQEDREQAAGIEAQKAVFTKREYQDEYQNAAGQKVVDFVNNMPDEIMSAINWLKGTYTKKNKKSQTTSNTSDSNSGSKSSGKMTDAEYEALKKRVEKGEISKEYLDELAYNSGYKPKSSQSTSNSKSSTTSSSSGEMSDAEYEALKKRVEKGEISKEYFEELVSNSKKNKYPSSTKKGRN